MINQETVTDAGRAIAFADDVRALYSPSAEMQAKIERYIAGLAAIAAETATARETKFVQLVQAVVDPEDLARIGALLPTISALVAPSKATMTISFTRPDLLVVRHAALVAERRQLRDAYEQRDAQYAVAIDELAQLIRARTPGAGASAWRTPSRAACPRTTDARHADLCACDRRARAGDPLHPRPAARRL